MRRWPEVALLLVVLVAIALALSDQRLRSDNSKPHLLRGRPEIDSGTARLGAPRWVPEFPAKSQPATIRA